MATYVDEHASRPGRNTVAEEYLVRIYVLLRESQPIVGARLAERLNVSPPAITQALRRMTRDGLVVQDRGNDVRLTDAGRDIAEAILRRHYLLERLLVDELGYNWAEVDEEADRLAHALSLQLEKHLFEWLGRPATCPHGNPFPGSPDEQKLIHARTLASVQAGETVTVLRVTEEGEEHMDLMYLLLEHQLLPGAVAQVVSVDEESKKVVLATPSGVAELPANRAVFVRVADPQTP
jgi:DtxR family Mn-dependent transcriptional regulator